VGQEKQWPKQRVQAEIFSGAPQVKAVDELCEGAFLVHSAGKFSPERGFFTRDATKNWCVFNMLRLA
jgi:hypothetical protein